MINLSLINSINTIYEYRELIKSILIYQFHKMVHMSVQTAHSALNMLDPTQTSLFKIYTIGKQEFEAIRKKQYPQEMSPKLLTNLALQTAPTHEAYLQILAQDGSYCAWENGEILTAPDFFENPRYKIKKTIEFKEGIKALLIVAENKTFPPLMIFRGTDPSNIDNVIDDLGQNIAAINCTKYAKQLEQELENLAVEHGRVHIIGHSYGGAVAQRLTAKHPHLIIRCTDHNAPGPGAEIIDEYFENLSRLPQNMTKPSIRRYTHAKDIIWQLGGGSLPVTEGYHYIMGRPTDSISHTEAHSFNALSTGAHISMNPDIDIVSPLEEWRQVAGKIVPLYQALRPFI